MPEKAFSVCIKDSVFIDPACGSGSLLLKAARILGKENIRQGFFGQEINLTTYNLCRINMFLHDIGFDKFNIANEDTLISPQHWDDEPFEVIGAVGVSVFLPDFLQTRKNGGFLRKNAVLFELWAGSNQLWPKLVGMSAIPCGAWVSGI